MLGSFVCSYYKLLTINIWWLLVRLSLRFNGHFPGESELAGVYWSKGWWRWWWQLDYWSYKSCKASVKSSPPTNRHPVFYRPDTLPVTQPTVSKHWRERWSLVRLFYSFSWIINAYCQLAVRLAWFLKTVVEVLVKCLKVLEFHIPNITVTHMNCRMQLWRKVNFVP